MRQFATSIFIWFSLIFGSNGIRLLPVKHYRLDCGGNPPQRYFARPRTGDNGFHLRIEGNPDLYEAEREYVLTLQSTLPGSFRGFSIRAVNSDDPELPAGSFTPINPFTARTLQSCTHVTSHVSSGKKTRVSARWRAPPTGFGCVSIKATVIQKGSVWFKNSDRLTLEICESSESVQPQTDPQCCACGTASYRMTFFGLWSPQTHPKDYPAYSTHWSNVVGASHSRLYSIWNYGELSTPAVQKVAEWGWPNDVEIELKSQGNDVMSIMKTKAQWPAFEPRNIRSSPSDTFVVDREHPLVSLLTMLGPSPDWNVGISKESMCTDQCGWIGERTYNLTPWDAGTDSGVSYMSPNSPTVPHEKIRALTTSDHPQSPFYDPQGGPVPPVARIVIRRISLQGESCGENEDVPPETEFDVGSSDISRGDSSLSCMYSEWGEWSDCGVSCGWGIKTRNRIVKAGSDCEATMAKEICKGSDHCENSEAATVCLYSDWTSWSSCGATCGSANKIRSRVLKWPSEERYCSEPLKEMSSCALPPCGEGDDCRYSSWGRWMPCSVTCGFGRTIRKRFVVSSSVDGSGCTELMQNSECLRSMTCEDTAVSDTTNCIYSPWSDWSDCPVTCGVGQAFRKRILVSSESTTVCRDFEMENSKCMTSSSCLDAKEEMNAPVCSYADWSEWMPCSTTCGVGATLRKRFLTGSDAAGICEGVIMERGNCHKRPCDNVQNQEECSYLPWSPWMPCSVTCGKGETLRKRFVSGDAHPSSCDPFQMETNHCMMFCDVSNVSLGCEYANWSPWMPCSAPCGQNGETFRKKLLVSSSRHCEAVVMETKPCVSPPCPSVARCELQPWQPWGECSITCGNRGVKIRQRLPSNSTSSVDCSTAEISERTRCRNPRCGRSCVLGEWSNWSLCGATCRLNRKYGFQIRRRKMQIRPRGRGRRCGARREKKKCSCSIIAT